MNTVEQTAIRLIHVGKNQVKAKRNHDKRRKLDMAEQCFADRTGVQRPFEEIAASDPKWARRIATRKRLLAHAETNRYHQMMAIVSKTQATTMRTAA